MQEARESLRHFGKSELEDLRSLNNPSKPIERVFSGLCIVFGQKPDWHSAQSLLSDPNILNKMINFNMKNLSKDTLDRLKSILNDPNLKEDSIRDTSMPALFIFKWLRALCDSSEKKESEEELGQSQKKQEVPEGFIEDVGIKMERKDSRMDEFMPEYEAAQEAMREIEKEICENGFKVDADSPRVQKIMKCLLTLLGEEDTTWENVIRITGNQDLLIKRIKKLDIQSIPQESVDMVRVWLHDPDLRLACLSNDSPAACHVLVWVTSAVNYWVVSQYIEKGEAALSEHAEEEARKQESEIIRSHSKILDEGENETLTQAERDRLKELDRHPSLGDF